MILVDIYVPAVDKSYDFNLDETVSVHMIIDEIVEMIGQKERTTIAGNTEELILCDRAVRRELPKEATLQRCGIRNGSSLLLV